MPDDEIQEHKISRRLFIQGLTTTSIATMIAPHLVLGQNQRSDDYPNIIFDRSNLPVIKNGDIIIIGGSFPAISAAIEFARSGKKVILIETRTYMGRELTATLRPWIDLGVLAENNKVPELIMTTLNYMKKQAVRGENAFKLDALKLALEDSLLEAGVDILYASHPLQILQYKDTIKGVVIGNKSGRQVLLGDIFIEATETSALARCAGSSFKTNDTLAEQYVRTIEFDDVQPPVKNSISVPADLGVAANMITVHQGYLGDTHYYLECPMSFSNHANTLSAAMQREVEARQRSIKIASYLVHHVPAFAKAHLAATSYELHGIQTPRLADDTPAWAKKLNTRPVSYTDTNLNPYTFSMSACGCAVKNLWCLQEAARLSEEQIQHIQSTVSGILIGKSFARSILSQWDQIDFIKVSEDPQFRYLRSSKFIRHLTVTSLNSPQKGRLYAQQIVQASQLPVFRNVDILVVGGGTAGASCAINAAKEGMKTVLLEMNPGLGGTGTLGGIDSYWFGRRIGFTELIDQSVKEIEDAIKHQPECEENGCLWNIEAKMYALLRDAETAGAEVFLNTYTIASIVQDNKLNGVVAVTKYGPIAVLAKVVIDATGDGDVAAFAGADFVLGSKRDHIPMWANLAQFVHPGRNENHFTSTADVTNIEDYTRYVLVGRRRGDCHDHGVYIASRETRHIKGEVTLTLTDQLKYKRWPDIINIHYSNCDIKGKVASDWLRVGLVPPNQDVEIPYRALLPVGLENILVVGKAISATKDILATIRMQADQQNLGGVAAFAAAQAVREGKSLRRIRIAELQKRIIKVGLLPTDILTRDINEPTYDREQIKQFVAAFQPERQLYEYSNMPMFEVYHKKIPFVEVCTADRSIAVPVLLEGLKNSTGKKAVRIAQALAMFGHPAAVPVLISEIKTYLKAGELPKREAEIVYTELPPDQGAMPDLAYLIYALGMTRDQRSLPLMKQIIGMMKPTDDDFRDFYKGTFYYIDAVCFVLELLDETNSIPLLEALHQHDSLREMYVYDHIDVDFVNERQALLELGIGRALALSGSPEGIRILISYLDDNRRILNEFAHHTLEQVTGRNFDKDGATWTNWINTSQETFRPVPITERNEE
jgi:ribulose 1,5-bisphosphate synthetase/thiazole synthase